MASQKDHIESGRAAAGERECSICGKFVKRVKYPQHLADEHSD